MSIIQGILGTQFKIVIIAVVVDSESWKEITEWNITNDLSM